VSEPKIAGPGVGAAHAEAAEAAAAPATPQGTGGHGAPAPEQSDASSQAAETANTVSPEQIAYLLRLGLNRREVCGTSGKQLPLRMSVEYQSSTGAIHSPTQ
jgi:hypothetical protein